MKYTWNNVASAVNRCMNIKHPATKEYDWVRDIFDSCMPLVLDKVAVELFLHGFDGCNVEDIILIKRALLDLGSIGYIKEEAYEE